MRIYTGNYDDCWEAFSSDGKSSEYAVRIFEELSTKSWWHTWYNRQGWTSKEENLRFYVESYYESTLKHLKPSSIFMKLNENDIILCGKGGKDFLERDVVAAWLELFYASSVRQVKLVDGKRVILPRSINFSTVKKMLETLIKADMDMHGYSCIAAAYAYERACAVAGKEKLRAETGVSEEMYLRLADALEKTYGQSSKKI